VLELVGTDDDDGQAGLEERLDDRTVGPLDGDLVGARSGEPPDEVAEAGGGMNDGEPLDHLAAGVDDRHRVVVASPVHASPLTVRRSNALSPIDGRRVPGNRRASQNSCWTSGRRASRAMARWHLGGIGGPVPATDMTMVLQ
jgi:hypothetical protein